MLKVLAEKYGETRQSLGISANNTVMEVFAAEAGSWTITATDPQGSMCLVASGEGDEAVVEVLSSEGGPS